MVPKAEGAEDEKEEEEEEEEFTCLLGPSGVSL